MAQSFEYTVEQIEYAPNKWDEFCVFREVQFKIGEPEPEFPSSNVTKVAFVDCKFSKIPYRFFDRLPQLKVLVVTNGTLEELEVKNGTKIVHAENNQITSLLIEGSGEMLKELHMQENPLRNINPIVSSLRGLEVLDLSRTNVAVQNDETIDLSLFASLPNLTELYLKNMQAHYVENKTGAFLSKLKLLDLSGNHFISNEFELKVFRTIPNLEELYLRDTIMTHLEFSDIREDLPALKRLYLDGNNFSCEFLESLLTHLKEKGIEAPTESRECNLGYDSIDELCCIYTMKYVPRNYTRHSKTVTQLSRDIGIPIITPTFRNDTTSTNNNLMDMTPWVLVIIMFVMIVAHYIKKFVNYIRNRRNQRIKEESAQRGCES